jgi:hypothetical protein
MPVAAYQIVNGPVPTERLPTNVEGLAREKR